MSLSTYNNPVTGSFKLDHDITPRDINEYERSSEAVLRDSNYRYRGFPLKNFDSPREPVTLDAETAEPPAPPLHKNYGLPNYFDQQRPKYVFKGHQGLQYGSNGLPVNNQQAKPIRDPFHEKTSADLRKFRHQQEEAESDIEKFKLEKKQRMQEREKEKQRDFDMLTSYNPWGKPGAGAPLKGDQHKQKFTEEELTPRNPPKRPTIMEEYGPDFHTSFGRPGAGAPLRTNSGKVKAELRNDEDIRFQDSHTGHKVNETEVRYKLPPSVKDKYGKELELQVRAKRLQAQESHIEGLKKELEALKHNPYGKPGAGAPNKTHSGMHVITPKGTTLTPNYLELRRLQRRKKEAENVARTQSNFEYYDPWGKGAGQATYDKYGDTRRYKFSDVGRGVVSEDIPMNAGNSLPVGHDEAPGGGGAPMKSGSGNVKTRMPITMRKDERGEASVREDGVPCSFPRLDSAEQIYDPFGKGGAGAPLRDDRGNVMTNVFGKLKTERASGDQRQKALAAQEYLEELQREMEEQRRTRDCESKQQRAGAGDLADVIKQGQVGRPKRDPNTGTLVGQHLGATDVTKQRADQRTMRNENSNLYHTELEEAAQNRRRVAELNKLREQREGKHHQEAMDSVWGRPGAGAPNPTGSKKSHLDTILFSPRTENFTDDYDSNGSTHVYGQTSYYNKQYESDSPPPNTHNYVRSTINSTHTNMYENPKDLRREPKKDYNLQTPWASAGVFGT